MKKRYKPMRIPLEAYENFDRKRKEIQETLNKELKKNKTIHLTDTIKFFSQRPSYIYNDELLAYFTKRKKRKEAVSFI